MAGLLLSLWQPWSGLSQTIHSMEHSFTQRKRALLNARFVQKRGSA